VAEALVEKFPCLKEPESFAGMHGWQQHTRCTISKLKSQKYTYPELEANRLNRKLPTNAAPELPTNAAPELPTNAAPAKNVKRHKKVEVIYITHHVGENPDTLEKERIELVNEM